MWCAVDYWVFEAPLWYYLAGLRLAASGCFFGLLLLPAREQMRDAYRALMLLFAIPTLFYIASHNLLSGNQLSDFSQAVATGYAFLPFVLMAGVAIFPLTVKENFLVAVAVMTAQLLAGYLNWSFELAIFCWWYLAVAFDCSGSNDGQYEPAGFYAGFGSPANVRSSDGCVCPALRRGGHAHILVTLGSAGRAFVGCLF